MEYGINYHALQAGVLRAKFFSPRSSEKLFESIKNIIDLHTKFIANDLKSYQSILLMYFSFNLVILIVFIIHNLLIKLRIKSRIRLYLKVRKLKKEIKKRKKEMKKWEKKNEKNVSFSL